MDSVTTPLKWYQRTGRILLVGCGTLAVVLVLMLAGMVLYYYRGIKSGKGSELAARFNGKLVQTTGFTSANGSASSGAAAVVDRAKLEQGDFPAIGSNNPKLTIVEFVDFKCPNCRLAAPILRQLIVEHGSEVRIISRNAPFESLHPGANRFAQVAWCANQQGRYWAVHDYFFEQQDSLPAELSPTDLGALATRFGLDATKFSQCLSDQRSLIAINRDYTDATALGVYGTPTFFVNGVKIEGVVPFASWEEVLKTTK